MIKAILQFLGKNMSSITIGQLTNALVPMSGVVSPLGIMLLQILMK